MNEPNNPVYRFFPLAQAAEALVLGKSIIQSNVPKSTVAVNISMEIWGWRRYLYELLTRSGRAIDIVGLDHYRELGLWGFGTVGQTRSE